MTNEFDLGSVIGPKGDKPAHQWTGTKLQFENPDGTTWGPAVDINNADFIYTTIGINSNGTPKLDTNGKADNEVLSGMVNDFLAPGGVHATDNAQMKISVSGTVGVNGNFTAGDWTSQTNPLRFFNFGIDGYTGKRKVYIDFENATIPPFTYAANTMTSGVSYYVDFIYATSGVDINISNIKFAASISGYGGTGTRAFGCYINGKASARVTNCTGEGHGDPSSNSYGYGCYLDGNAMAVVADCTGIAGGSAYDQGCYGYGCYLNGNAAAKVTNCTGTAGSGYGCFLSGNATAEVTNCSGIGSGDYSYGYGNGNGYGCYLAGNSRAVVINCTGTASAPWSSSYGYGCYLAGNARAVVTNCAGSSNAGPSYGSSYGYGCYLAGNATAEVCNCTGTGNGTGVDSNFGLDMGSGGYGCYLNGTGVKLISAINTKGYIKSISPTKCGAGIFVGSSASNNAIITNFTCPQAAHSDPNYVQTHGLLIAGTGDGATAIISDGYVYKAIDKHNGTAVLDETGTAIPKIQSKNVLIKNVI